MPATLGGSTPTTCPQTITDSDNPVFSGDKVTLYYILNSPSTLVSGFLKATLNGPNYSQTQTVNWMVGNSYNTTIAITFDGIQPGTTYNVSEAEFSSDDCEGWVPISNDELYGTIDSPSVPATNKTSNTSGLPFILVLFFALVVVIYMLLKLLF